MERPVIWFIPFVLVVCILTFPYALYDPIIGLPPMVVAAGFGVYLLIRDRQPGDLPNPFLTAAMALIVLIVGGIAVLTALRFV